MRAALFDLDGVIVDSMAAHVEAWHQALQEAGIPSTKEELRTLGGLGPAPTIERFSERAGRDLTQQDMEGIYRRAFELVQTLSRLEIFPEIPSILSLLQRKQVLLALVTSSGRSYAEAILDNHLPGYFEAIISQDDVAHTKPNPEPYQKALEALGVPAEEAIVIEDSPLGIQSGMAAGIFTIALQTTVGKDLLKEADLVLKDHEALLSYLKKKIK